MRGKFKSVGIRALNLVNKAIKKLGKKVFSFQAFKKKQYKRFLNKVMKSNMPATI